MFRERQTKSGLTCQTLARLDLSHEGHNVCLRTLPPLKTDPELILTNMHEQFKAYKLILLFEFALLISVVVLDRHCLHNSIPNNRWKYMHLKVDFILIFLCTYSFTPHQEICIHNLKVYHLFIVVSLFKMKGKILFLCESWIYSCKAEK